MLIKSSDDLKKLVPGINRALSWLTMEGFVMQATDLYIRPAIGPGLLQELTTEYDPEAVDNGLGDAANELVKRLRLALANYSLMKAIPFLNVSIGDVGITQDQAAADKFAVFDTCRAAGNTADQYLEMALDWLESKKSDFPTWTASETYQRTRELLIGSPAGFNRFVQVQQPMRVFRVLVRHLEEAEDVIVNVLGQALTDRLRSAWKADTMTLDEKLLRVQCLPVIALTACIAGVRGLQVRIDENGPRVMSYSTGLKSEAAASTEQTTSIIKELVDRRDRSLNVLTRFLQTHAANYPEYQPDLGAGSSRDAELPANNLESSIFSLN